MPEIATKLGCKPKEHFKKLKDGTEVQLDDGTIVRPDQVLGNPPPRSCFAVIYLPDNTYVDSLL